MSVAWKLTWVFSASLASFAAAAQGDGFVVDSVVGNAIVEQLGDRSWLHGGETFAERDVIRVGAGGALRLAFDHFGSVELGPETEIAIEKLPLSADPADAKTIVTLAHGELRVEWHRPADSMATPLYVFFGSQRANISDGEYFFTSSSAGREACAARGGATVMPSLSSAVLALSPSYCFVVEGTAAPRLERRDSTFWAAARERMMPAHGAEPAAQPPPAPVKVESLEGAGAATSRPGQPSAAVPQPVAHVSSAGTSATADGAEPVWALNLGSYAEAEIARGEARKLSVAGYAPVVMGVQIDGRTWYRLQLRGFSTAAEARAKADSLRDTLGFKGAWLVQQPYRAVSAAY